jgi:hypothetical protein
MTFGWTILRQTEENLCKTPRQVALRLDKVLLYQITPTELT